MKFLSADENNQAEWKSSAYQYKDREFLTGEVGGVTLPIVFDYIDYIDCDHIESHPVTLTLGDDIGYDFPVGHYKYTTDQYVLVDHSGVETKMLPAWFGEGFYKEYVDKLAFTNFDNGALAIRNEENLRIGLEYAKCKKTIEGV